MSDYRFDLEAPIRAHERGRMGAGDHPLSDGRLAALFGGRRAAPKMPDAPDVPDAPKRIRRKRTKPSRK